MSEAVFTTQPMTKEKAFQYAKAIEGNPNFTEVFVVPRANERFAVQYRPATEEGMEAEKARKLEANVRKALAEGPKYLWDAADTGRFYRVKTTSNSVYEVASDGSTCDCMDFVGRCMKLGGVGCKHVIALKLGLGKRTDGKPLGIRL